jgi:hypothetical protein
MLLALIEAWRLDENDHAAFRGIRSHDELAHRLPRFSGNVAPLTEKAVEDYAFSIRCKIRECLGLTPEANHVARRGVETVRGQGYRAGDLLRDTRVNVRNVEARHGDA